MLSAIFGVLSSIPQIVSLIEKLIASWSAYQKEKEQGNIDQAAKDAEQAKTDEELKKAAEEAANATRHL